MVDDFLKPPVSPNHSLEFGDGDSCKTGVSMYRWASDLFPICRSITGNGVRKTLSYFQRLLPALEIFEVPTGTKAFDWIVPDEWNVNSAWIKDEDGNVIADFRINNLHLVGYSIPVDIFLNFEQLQGHLHTLPDQPDAIPYVTSYYEKNWGFCITENTRRNLKKGRYHVHIDSKLAPGNLSYGELILKGESDKEVFISTYICHPSMANNELSGPVVAAAVYNWLEDQETRKYTYRIIFIPETIGSLVYLSRHFKELKQNVIAGFVLTCIGDDNAYSMLESRLANTLADKILKHVLKYHAPDYKTYSFLERGSDERQYCAPGIDLPVCDIMRTKYGQYTEYHTSLDNMDCISPEGLEGGFEVVKKCISLIENNNIYKTKVLGEPQLGKRGLYPTISKKNAYGDVYRMRNLIAYADGNHDLVDLAEIINENALELAKIAEDLVSEGIFEMSNNRNE
jgi:aminopeptidase-like protein